MNWYASAKKRLHCVDRGTEKDKKRKRKNESRLNASNKLPPMIAAAASLTNNPDDTKQPLSFNRINYPLNMSQDVKRLGKRYPKRRNESDKTDSKHTLTTHEDIVLEFTPENLSECDKYVDAINIGYFNEDQECDVLGKPIV